MGSLRSVIRNGVLDRLSWGNEVRLKKIFRILSDPLYFKNYRRYGLIGDEVRIDASTRCQLKCPICPTATGENRERPLGWGDLSFEHFKQFVDRYPGIRKIELSNWGEIFLNPEIGEIIRYGYEKGIELSAVNGVNLNTVKDEVLEALVKYRFRAMTVSSPWTAPRTSPTGSTGSTGTWTRSWRTSSGSTVTRSSTGALTPPWSGSSSSSATTSTRSAARDGWPRSSA